MDALYKSRPERWPQVSLKGLFVLLTLLGIVLEALTKPRKSQHCWRQQGVLSELLRMGRRAGEVDS